ncbi:MAG TPA: SCO family protein [Solirubrobacteraceae bacterium]|nr:SCO family protein [Solirubrobacteraceae bacterium]
MSRRGLCALGLVLAGAIATGAASPRQARADGDPASDVLVGQAFFVPVDAGFSDAQRSRLATLLSSAERAHHPIRVAIIPSAFDLGAITELWLKPAAYAPFLGIELSLVYNGPLLVVMPDGFGFYWAGHDTAAADRLLAKIHVGSGGEGLLDTVQTAVRELASGSGASTTPAARASGGSDLLEVLVAVAIAALVAFVAVAIGRRRGGGEATRAGRRFPVSPGAVRAWLGWAVPLVAIAVAGVVIVRALAPKSRPRAHPSADRLENPPSIFPADRTRAPDFLLRDQHDRPVSLGAYRGHWVLLTFVDPLAGTRDGPTAKVLAAAERALPPSKRPEILAVSADVYGDAPATLSGDLTSWHLPPQWRWAVGPPAQLAAVWDSYFAEVHVTTRTVAGVAVRSVVHSKMAYLIDPKGYERMLFGWPYSTRELEVNLRRLEGV